MSVKTADRALRDTKTMQAPDQLDLFSMPVSLPAEAVAQVVLHASEVKAPPFTGPESPIHEPSGIEETFAVASEQPDPGSFVPEPGPAEVAVVWPNRAVDKRQFSWGIDPKTSFEMRRWLNDKAYRLLTEIEREGRPATDDELNTLSSYTGRGGIGDSLNEYYTPLSLAEAMWRLAEKCGFRGGPVLEPSCGTGVFLRTAPLNARVTGVELSSTSAALARLIHEPAGHEIIARSFEQMATTDIRQFEMVIGNPPFGVRGDNIQIDKRNLTTAQEYFIDTALSKAVTGGLVIYVLPTSVMDGAGHYNRFRAEMLLKAEFVTAFRLPNSAFTAAGTNIPTDLLVLRKRDEEIVAAASVLSAQERAELGLHDPQIVSGDYFTGRGKANILGVVGEGWRARAGLGEDFAINGPISAAIERIDAWEPEPRTLGITIDRILASVDDEFVQDRMRRAVLTAAQNSPRHGDIKIVGGLRYQFQNFEGDKRPKWVEAPAPLPAAILSAYQIGSGIEALMSQGGGDADLRAKLMAMLDTHLGEHGNPRKDPKVDAWLREPFWPIELTTTREDHQTALASAKRAVAATLGAVDSDGSYSDLLTGNRREVALQSLDEAISSFSVVSGTFTILEIAIASGIPAAEIETRLMGDNDFAVHADGLRWEARDRYLSGELWPKFDAARVGAAYPKAPTWLRGRLEAQAKSLEQAIAPASLEDVEVAINSGFITPADLTAWLQERAIAAEAQGFQSYNRPTPAEVSFQGGYYWITPSRGGKLYGDLELLSEFLNREGIRKVDIPKIEAMNADFRLWALTGSKRQSIEDRYNRSIRGYVKREYSTAPIAVPGLNPNRSLNEYHYAALRWALDEGRGILAYDVGVGKTTVALLLGRLAMATGRARQVGYFVPLNVTANWEAECLSWFPDAKILVVGETKKTRKDGSVTAQSDSASVIRAKLHSLRQNNFDFVFITEPAWNRIDLSPEKKAELISRDFWVQRAETLNHAGTKKINKIRENYEQAVAGRNFTDREDTIYFDDLPFDMLIGDEIHRMKNLFAARNRWGNQPKFLGGSGQSNRAYDTYLKASHLRDLTNGYNVYGCSASPTKNSPLEVYSLCAIVAPESFEKMGIRNAEEFLDRFCVFEIQPILNLKGEIEETTVVSGFKNLDELQPILNRYIYRKTAADVGLKIPDSEPIVHIVDMSPTQKMVYEEIRQAMADKSEGASNIHIFQALDKMSKASLDLGLIDLEQYKGEASPILDACVTAAVADIKETGDAQLIFCDYINLHERIKADLVDAGIDPKRIVIMNAITMPRSEDRYRIQEEYNKGAYDVVIGNAPTIGEGLNLMVCTGGSHVLNIPWDPDSYKQIRGRGRRQGNLRDKVKEHVYFDKGGVSAYRYQVLSGKKDWSEMLWSGAKTVENPASTGGFSRMELMIMLAADPVAARAKYESDMAAAQASHANFAKQQAAKEYQRLQERHVSLESLGENGRTSDVGARLQRSIDVITESLEANDNFQPKYALSSPHSFIYVPAGDIALGIGDAIYSNENGRSYRKVVLAVDPINQTVKLGPFDHIDSESTEEDLESLAKTLTSENTRVIPSVEANRGLHLSELLLNVPVKRKPLIKNIESLALLGDEWIDKNEQAIRVHIIAGLNEYDITTKTIAYRDPALGIKITDRWGLVKLIDRGIKDSDIDLILPTENNLRDMISLAISLDRQKRLKEGYITNNGKNARGIKEKYGDYSERYESSMEHANPAISCIKSTFGPKAAQQAATEVLKQAWEDFKLERNPARFLDQAARLINIPFGTSVIPWTGEIVMLLATRYAESGLLYCKLSDVVHFAIKDGPGTSQSFFYNDKHVRNYRLPPDTTVIQFIKAIAFNAQVADEVDFYLQREVLEHSIAYDGAAPVTQQGEINVRQDIDYGPAVGDG